ncbi:hypothetical protein BH24ACT22_BH24ACT22_14150 [soil metagenome]
MKGSGNQELLERIENLEQEVEGQRLLLRHTLSRFGRETVETYEKDTSEKQIEVQTTKPRQTVGGKEVPDVSPLISTVRRQDGNTHEKEGFGALAALFRLRGWEWWLNKIGIGLLLFGVVFLFKFSVDQGWLIPEVRVGVGLALGATLVWLGLRVYEERRAFSQVMLGGGIGTFYITGFAAFQLYALVPYALAFVFLVVVTLLAFTLSVRQDDAALALIGAAGGFGTPFLLYDGSGGLGGLALYTALILSGIAAIYMYKGWRSLLLFSSAGVGMVLLAGYAQSPEPALEAGLNSLQAVTLFAALVLWLVPVGREVLRQRNPGRWPVPEPGNLVRSFSTRVGGMVEPGLPAHLLSGVVPLAGLAFTQEIWDLPKEPLGWISFCGAAAYAGVSVMLRRVEVEVRLYYTNSLTALMLFTLGIVLVLEGNALFLALALEAALLHLVAHRLGDRLVSGLGHSLFLIVGVWFSERVLSGIWDVFGYGATDWAFLNVDALLNLLVVALAFGVSTTFASRRIVHVYRILAHAAILGLLFRELIGVLDGSSAAFLAWAAYATMLVLLSSRYPQWGTFVGSHVLWTVVGLWFAGRLAWDFVASNPERVAVFNLSGAVDLAVIFLTLLAGGLLSPGKSAIAYRMLAHAAVLAWLWRELGAFPDGAAYVTISWGFYAAGLLVFGLRRAGVGVLRVGIITLFLVVGKLFLVDLAWVGAVWRILLFLGFGGLFLVLSYYLQTLWQPGAQDRSRDYVPASSRWER